MRTCMSSEDWLDELEAMLDNERRMQLGSAIQDYVLGHAMADRSVRAWRAALGAEA